jgi:hypothetical protein
VSKIAEPISAPRPTNVVTRRSVSLRTRIDIGLDVALFLGFGIAYSFFFTGLPVHEWFGLAFGVALLTHLTLHWDWVLQATKRLFSKTGRRRFVWAINLLLLVDMTLCVASGIAISAAAIPALGIQTAQASGYWTELHTRTASAAIVLIALHIGFDFRWIVSVVRRLLGRTRK